MLETEDHGPIRTLRLARPPVNALNLALITALDAACARAAGEGVRGIVITGAGGRYTAGLDVQELLALDRAGLSTFIGAFHDFLGRLAALPLPVVAALNGHAPAGGAVLSLFCDRRVMAEGEFRIGLNEVQVGIQPGATIYRAFERVVGTRVASQMLPAGRLVTAREALAVGLVDELAPLAEVEARARAWLAGILELPPLAYAATRALTRADLVALMARRDAADLEAAVGAWSSAETRATLAELLARLGRK
jgi:enoyl-CoA hydratase/carnithine racemase